MLKLNIKLKCLKSILNLVKAIKVLYLRKNISVFFINKSDINKLINKY